MVVRRQPERKIIGQVKKEVVKSRSKCDIVAYVLKFLLTVQTKTIKTLCRTVYIKRKDRDWNDWNGVPFNAIPLF